MDWSTQHPAYTYGSLADEHLSSSPWVLWEQWQKEAQTVLKYTNEIALATADREGNVSVRYVLLKYSNKEKGFWWYTNTLSEKAQQLHANPHAELLWYCKEHQRQVRIRGDVTQLPRAQVRAYAHTRPFKSQISALISNQSQKVASKKELSRLFDAACTKYKDVALSAIPVSKYWAGFALMPVRFEFWQGNTNRLHDRIIYQKKGTDGWEQFRLFP